MKNFYSGLLLIFCVITLLSCQKELTLEAEDAVGTLKFESTGDCLPVIINGSYQKDVLLNTNNYIDIQADISQTGNYTISTDTLNGYYFNATGSVAQAGLNTIRLEGHGRPMAASVDVFTVTFSGTSCQVNVIVTGIPTGSTAAVYSLGGSPGTCSGAVLSGTFMQGLAMDPTNTATLTVNVTTPGAYSINTGSVNGVTFIGTGNFSAAGPATVVLTASGTPVAANTSAYSVNSGTGSCSFNVVYSTSTLPATYSINCATPVLAGIYMQGVATTASNTVSLSVNVTVPGTYNILVAPVNGVTFTGAGTFTATGPATILLTASGTPTAAGTLPHLINSGSGSCSFNVTYASAPNGPAVYTMNCATLVLGGSYVAGVPLNSTNTLTLTVNITTPGTYTIGGSVAGITFLTSGTFPTAPATQTVTITGTGTPTFAGMFGLPVVGSGIPCTPVITVIP